MADELPTKEPVSHQASVLDRHDDPFAPREGKTLIWKDINMTLVSDMCYTNGTSLSFFRLRFLGLSESHSLIVPLLQHTGC